LIIKTERIIALNPLTVFCPNMNCPARGRINEGNISVHSLKEHRYKCSVCDKTFAETKGTPFYRLRHSQELVTQVITLLSFGCPTQAIVAAFGLDERTVSDWRDRAGCHCQALHEKLVATPRDLGQVQMDELRVKLQGRIVWMALALMVSTRLWLGGVVASSRDRTLITNLVEKVRASASALCAGILFCTDGLKAYITAIRLVFRESVPTGQVGRPRLQSWRRIFIAQTVKQYEQGRVIGVERRIIQGSQAEIDTMLERTQGRGVINTAFIERVNATFRQCLSSLARRTRAIARHSERLEAGMYLVGSVYNFCCEHKSLRIEGLIGGHKWLERTPAMAAGITQHRWTVRELLSFHVVPAPWKPIKTRGRPSTASKQLIARWCQ
jgi:transposase-like protein/IS1 family transposase